MEPQKYKQIHISPWLHNGRETKIKSSHASQTSEARRTMEYALQVPKENNFPPRSYAHQIYPVSREQISSDRPWLEVLTPWGPFLSKLFRFSRLDILFLTVCLVHFSILISTMYFFSASLSPLSHPFLSVGTTSTSTSSPQNTL